MVGPHLLFAFLVYSSTLLGWTCEKGKIKFPVGHNNTLNIFVICSFCCGTLPCTLRCAVPDEIFYSTCYIFLVTTSKKSNTVVTEGNSHIFKEYLDTTPYNGMNIRDNTRKHNPFSLEVHRETTINRHEVLNTYHKNKRITKASNLAKKKEGKINKNRTSPLKLVMVEGNQAPSLQEANEFDKNSRHNEFNKEFYNENSVVTRKLDRYLKGDINKKDMITKFKYRVNVSTLNTNDSLNYDWEDHGRNTEKRKRKFTVRHLKNSLNNSPDWNFPYEANYYGQPKNGKAKIFNHDRHIHNKHRSYLNESAKKTERFHTTRLKWKLLDKAANLYEDINIRKLMPKRKLVIPNLRLDKDNSYSDITVNDVMEAVRNLRYDTSSFKTSKQISLLKNISSSFANKMFNTDKNNRSSQVKTVTPSKFARKAEYVNKKAFDSQKTSTNMFTNLSSGSILSNNVNRSKIKWPGGKEVATKANSDDFHYYKDKILYREKKRNKSVANDINDFTRQPSKIAKYKKRLHSKLGDLNEFVKKIPVPSSNCAEDIIKNSLNRSSKHATRSDEKADNNGRKSRIYDNIMANIIDTKQYACLMTKTRLTQGNALSRHTKPMQSTDNVDSLPALTLKFNDHRKIPPFNKHLREETRTITNIKDVLFNYLKKLTNMKRGLKVALVKDNIEMSTIKTIQQNELKGRTFIKSQESANNKILPTKLNMRRSELATMYKDTSLESLPKYRSVKPASLAKTSKMAPEDKMKFDSTKASNIMQLKKSIDNHEAYTTTTNTFKTVEHPTFAERILAKILDLKSGTYDMPMLKEKLNEAELRLRNSVVKYVNVSETDVEDHAKSSSTTYPRPVLLESLKYPSVIDIYPGIGRWQPKLELGSGVPTIVTNVSNDLTNEMMPPMRHWNAVLPPNKPASYNEDDYLEEMMKATSTEIPIHIKFKKHKRIQTQDDKKSKFHYEDRPDDKFLRNKQKLPYKDMNIVNPTGLAIRQEMLRQKARKKFLEQIEGVGNKDLIKILFTSPYINRHLNVNPSLIKQPPDVFHKDMYSVLPLDVANYQKYKKEDRQSQKSNVFVSDDNYYNRPRWVLPINSKNKFQMQSIDGVSSLDKIENDFLDITKGPETTVFPQTDVDDIVSDLANDPENMENKLESDEISAHDKLYTTIGDDIEPIYEKAIASAKHPLPTDRLEEIQVMRSKEEDILGNIVKTYKKFFTTTEKIKLTQLNNEFLMSNASLLEDIEDKDTPIIDEGLRPIEKITKNTEKINTEFDEFARYIEDVDQDYDPAKIHLITFRPKYVTVIPRKYTTLKTYSRWEEETDEKNMKTSYSKPVKDTGIKYPDSISTYKTAPVKDSNNVFLPTYLTSPLHRKHQYYVKKPQKPTTSASSAIMTDATSRISDDEFGISLLKDFKEQDTVFNNKNLRPVQKFWNPIIFATTARTTIEPVFNKLFSPTEKHTNNTDKPSTESYDLVHFMEGVERDYELAKTHLTTFKPKYSPVKRRKFTTFKTHITWDEEIDKKNKKTSYSKPTKGTAAKYSDGIPTFTTASIKDTNKVFLPNYLTSPFQRKDQYYNSKPRIPINSASWPIVTYATSPISDDEVEPSVSNYLEDQETPIINKDLRPVQTFWKPRIFATTARTNSEPAFDELFRPIEKPIINTDKPSTESDNLAHYIEDVERHYGSAKIQKPEYEPRKFTPFKTHGTWEEEIDKKNKKTDYLKHIKGPDSRYSGRVPTYKTAPIEDTNNVFHPFQEKDQYNISQSRNSTTGASWPIVTYATLRIMDDEVGFSQSTDLEEPETPINDKVLRPALQLWKPIIFATTARTTTEPIITYPTQALQGNYEMDIEGMSPKLIYDMETERTQKTNENQEDSQYERFWNNLIGNNVTVSTSTTLSSQDGSEVTQMTRKNSSFKLNDWRGFQHKTTYLPNIRLTVTPRRKEKEEGVFYHTLYDLENEELTTAKINVSWNRPTLRFEDKNEEPIDITLIDQNNEYKNVAIPTLPTFRHRTLPIFKDIGITTDSISPAYGNDYDERYKLNEILANISRNPVLTTYDTIFKPYTYSVPAKDERILNVTLSKENDEDILEKPILENYVTLKPFLSQNESGTDETFLERINEELKQPVSMTTPSPTRTPTSSKSGIKNLTKSRFVESKAKKFDNSNYTRSTITRPINTPTLTRNKLKSTSRSTTTRPVYTSTLTRNKLKHTLSGHILKSTVSRHISKTTSTKHIERTATRTHGSYNEKNDATDDEGIIFHKNDVIILNNNHTKVSTNITDRNESSLAIMRAKDDDAQSPMIDIGLRPVESKWKPLYIYGADKTLKKDRNDSEKIKDYDEKFLNEKLTDEPDCKEDKCTSKKKYTTVIRPTKTYSSHYRNTSTNVVILPNVQTVDESGPKFKILFKEKLPNYTEINHKKNTLKITKPFEFVTLSAVNKYALNKSDNAHKIKPTEFEMSSYDEIFTNTDKVPGQKNYTKYVPTFFLEPPTESASSPTIKFAPNVSEVFPDKAPKNDTVLVFEKILDENNRRPTISDSSPDKKFEFIVSDVPHNDLVKSRIETTTFPIDEHYSTTTEMKYETSQTNDKAPNNKNDTVLIFEKFLDENKQRPTDSDNSLDKKLELNVSDVPHNDIEIRRIETTTFPFNEHYATTTELKYVTSKTKFNQDSWKPSFFPKRNFTTTKPTIKLSRTPSLKEKYENKNKLNLYPSNIDLKETKLLTPLQHHLPFFPTLNEVTKYWTEYVQYEGTPTRMTTKYMYKPMATSPIGFASIEYQSTSPIQSTGESPPNMSKFIPRPSERTQETDEYKKKIIATSKYMPIRKPEKYRPFKHRYTQPIFTYPTTSPQTTKYRWPKPTKASDRDVQEKQSGKYPYVPIAVLGKFTTQKFIFIPFTTSTFKPTPYWSAHEEKISKKEKPKLVLPVKPDYVPILEQQRYKTPKSLLFPYRPPTTLQSTDRWTKPNRVTDKHLQWKPKLGQFPYVPSLAPKFESTGPQPNSFTTTTQRPWIGSFKETYRLRQKEEKVNASVEYPYVTILETERYPNKLLTTENNNLMWRIHPVFEGKEVNSFPVFSTANGKGVIPVKSTYTTLEEARNIFNKKGDWKLKLQGGQQKIPIPIHTYSFTPKYVNVTKIKQNSYKAQGKPYTKPGQVAYFVPKVVIPTLTYRPVPTLIPYTKYYLPNHLPSKAPTRPEYDDRRKIKYPPTYVDQSGHHKKLFNIFIDLTELPNTHNDTNHFEYPDNSEYLDKIKLPNKNIYSDGYPDKYTYSAKGKNRYYPGNEGKYFDKEVYSEKGTYYNKDIHPDKERLSDKDLDINKYQYKNKYPDIDQNSNKGFKYPYENKFYQDQHPKPLLISPVKDNDQYNKNSYFDKYTNEPTISPRPLPGNENKDAYLDKDTHPYEKKDPEKITYPDNYRYLDKNKEPSKDKYPDKHRYSDDHRYQDKNIYSDRDRYIDKEKETSKDIYPDKDEFIDKGRYSDDDRYRDRNIYSDRDIYTDKGKENSEDKYVDTDRYPDKSEYSDKERYPDEDKYYKYPPIVNVDSTNHTSAHTLLNDKDSYPNIEKDKHHHKEKSDYDKYRQEEKYYDQKYRHKYKYHYQVTNVPPSDKYTTLSIFVPKRIHNYKAKYPEQYKPYFDDTTRNVYPTTRIPSVKDRIKYPDRETYSDDGGYSNDVKYQDKNEPNRNRKPAAKLAVKDIFIKNTGSDEYIIASARPILDIKYPDKDIYRHKDRHRNKDINYYKNNNYQKDNANRDDPQKNSFFQVQYTKPAVIPTMKAFNKYPDEDKNSGKHIYSDKNRNPNEEYQDEFSVPTYANFVYTTNYPYLPDVTTLPSVSAKPSVATTPVRVNYEHDVIPGGITKEHAKDNRPRVPSVSNNYTYGLDENPNLKSAIVHGPGEKDATPTEGSELDEINYENRSTLPYQPELHKVTDLFKKTTLPDTKVPYSAATAKDEIPNSYTYNTQGAEDKKPELRCGKDKSPVRVVYEGAAKIETYPWLGILVYPRGR